MVAAQQALLCEHFAPVAQSAGLVGSSPPVQPEWTREWEEESNRRLEQTPKKVERPGARTST